VDATAGYTRLSDVPELRIPGPDGQLRTIFPNIPHNYSLGVDASVPLYTGGSLRAGVDAAEGRRSAAEADVEAGDDALVLEVTGAYWRLALAGEERRVASAAVASFEAHLEDAENRRRFGMAAANEVLAVQVERDRAELQRIEAEHRRALAEADLERLLDLPPATEIVADGSPALPELPAAELETLVALALERRPERSAQVDRVAAAEAAVAVAEGALKPQLRAAGGYDLARPNRRILPPEDRFEDSWDVGIFLRYRLFDGGARRDAVAAAEARADAASRRLEGLDRRLRLEVTERRLELATARATVTVAESAVASAREGLEVAADRYREGLAPSSERLDAETALLRAELDLARAEVRVRLARAGLERAVGGELP
jgi:outer membrane protein TolC